MAVNKQAGTPLFSDVSQETVKTVLKDLSIFFQRNYPNAPNFTEGRLRRAFTVLITQAGLNEVYGAMISGQWRTILRTPLHYTTLTFQQLADRFRPSSRIMVERLRYFGSTIPELDDIPLSVLPERYQGSPYCPRPEVVLGVITKLIAYIEKKTSPHDRHNVIILAAFIGLDLFCGLRFSELCDAEPIQFDLDAVWQGQPMPWLQLPDTKGNRFTTAARLVPIYFGLVPLVKKLLLIEEKGLFICWDADEKKKLNRDILDKWREEAGIPLLRWHSCRQEVNSALFLCTTSMETANVILGHQNAGRELFNPYLPGGDPFEHWKTFLEYCQKFDEEIGWKKVIDVIGTDCA
jgi:integrase